MGKRRDNRLEIGSYSELLEHEGEILERIERTPNGGNLFMAHPLRLLADIGVVLSKRVEDELVVLHPELSGLGATPYDALKATRQTQNVRFRIQGLFRRRPE